MRCNVYAARHSGPMAPPSRKEVIVHREAVAILPLLEGWPEHETLVMIRNERFAVGQSLNRNCPPGC